MQGRRQGSLDADPVTVASLVMTVVFMGAVGAALFELPLLVWGLLHGELVLANPFVLAITVLFAVSGLRSVESWDVALGLPAGSVPSMQFMVLVDVGVIALAVMVAWAMWLRIDRWRGLSQAGASELSLRRLASPRSWAKPRDWLHLQVSEQPGVIRDRLNRVLRVLLRERRSPDPVDSWALGRLRGAVIRSARELHLFVCAPTRSGKTLRLLVAQVRSHRGPIVVMSNKLDIVAATYWQRALLGPVRIFAPFSDLSALRAACCGWTPLRSCVTWSGAQQMAQWLADADTDASSVSDGGGRFYVREAVEKVLPPLLHAAALSGGQMVDVYRWLGNRDELEEARMILAEHGALQAEQEVYAILAMESRQFSFASSSTRQLISAYRFHEVQIHDHAELLAEDAIEGCATTYVIAPDSAQEMMAPLNAAIIAETVRACEQRARHAPDPATLPIVKIVVDEAGTIAPLRRMPVYLSMAGSLGVRFALCYQSLGQLHGRYGKNDANTILANCGVKVFLGPITDPITSKTVIELFGEEEVEKKSTSTDRRTARRSDTTVPELRPKVSVNDLQRLPAGHALVHHHGDLTARTRLPFWWEQEGWRTPEDALENDRAAWKQRGQK